MNWGGNNYCSFSCSCFFPLARDRQGRCFFAPRRILTFFLMRPSCCCSSVLYQDASKHKVFTGKVTHQPPWDRWWRTRSTLPLSSPSYYFFFFPFLRSKVALLFQYRNSNYSKLLFFLLQWTQQVITYRVQVGNGINGKESVCCLGIFGADVVLLCLSRFWAKQMASAVSQKSN